MTLTRGTPPSTPHMEAPPPGILSYEKTSENNFGTSSFFSRENSKQKRHSKLFTSVYHVCYYCENSQRHIERLSKPKYQRLSSQKENGINSYKSNALALSTNCKIFLKKIVYFLKSCSFYNFFQHHQQQTL